MAGYAPSYKRSVSDRHSTKLVKVWVTNPFYLVFKGHADCAVFCCVLRKIPQTRKGATDGII